MSNEPKPAADRRLAGRPPLGAPGSACSRGGGTRVDTHPHARGTRRLSRERCWKGGGGWLLSTPHHSTAHLLQKCLLHTSPERVVTYPLASVGVIPLFSRKLFRSNSALSRRVFTLQPLPVPIFLSQLSGKTASLPAPLPQLAGFPRRA